MVPNALIISTAGTNCDHELAEAFRLAGAAPSVVHLNELIAKPGLIDRAELIGFPGGFSYGDDIAAGRIFADRLRRGLIEHLLAARERRVPMIGICNGFQVLVALGFLPDPSGSVPPTVTMSLAQNLGGRFVARWTHLRVNRESPCVWTAGLDDRIELPVAHAEGRLIFKSQKVLDQIRLQGQVVFEYDVDPNSGKNDNPSGSTSDIAGVCDPTGLVLGLMPHPERYTAQTHHPQWTRQPQNQADHMVPSGLAMFRAAVSFVVRDRAKGQAKGGSRDLVRS